MLVASLHRVACVGSKNPQTCTEQHPRTPQPLPHWSSAWHTAPTPQEAQRETAAGRAPREPRPGASSRKKGLIEGCARAVYTRAVPAAVLNGNCVLQTGRALHHPSPKGWTSGFPGRIPTLQPGLGDSWGLQPNPRSSSAPSYLNPMARTWHPVPSLQTPTGCCSVEHAVLRGCCTHHTVPPPPYALHKDAGLAGVTTRAAPSWEHGPQPIMAPRKEPPRQEMLCSSDPWDHRLYFCHKNKTPLLKRQSSGSPR